MRASHGEARRGGASSLSSSSSSAAAPPVASPVVPATEFANADAGASSDVASAGIAVGPGREEVVEIIGELNLCSCPARAEC